MFFLLSQSQDDWGWVPPGPQRTKRGTSPILVGKGAKQDGTSWKGQLGPPDPLQQGLGNAVGSSA